ncbi:MAG: GNAT family N-acetyltransferase [Pseudomonadota bacterium]
MTDRNVPQRSERVVLRRLNAGDLDAFQAYRNDPEVARHQGWQAMDDTRAQGFLRHMETAEILLPGEWSQLALADRNTGALIGDVGVYLAEDETRAELGITLSQAAQGKGLALEALTIVCRWLWSEAPIARIEAITSAENTRALTLLNRSPFSFTHTTHETEDGTQLTEHWFELRRS